MSSFKFFKFFLVFISVFFLGLNTYAQEYIHIQQDQLPPLPPRSGEVQRSSDDTTLRLIQEEINEDVTNTPSSTRVTIDWDFDELNFDEDEQGEDDSEIYDSILNQEQLASTSSVDPVVVAHSLVDKYLYDNDFQSFKREINTLINPYSTEVLPSLIELFYTEFISDLLNKNVFLYKNKFNLFSPKTWKFGKNKYQLYAQYGVSKITVGSIEKRANEVWNRIYNNIFSDIKNKGVHLTIFDRLTSPNDKTRKLKTFKQQRINPKTISVIAYLILFTTFDNTIINNATKEEIVTRILKYIDQVNTYNKTYIFWCLSYIQKYNTYRFKNIEGYDNVSTAQQIIIDVVYSVSKKYDLSQLNSEQMLWKQTYTDYYEKQLQHRNNNSTNSNTIFSRCAFNFTIK